MLFKSWSVPLLVFSFLAVQCAGLQHLYGQDNLHSMTRKLCNTPTGASDDAGLAYRQALACLLGKLPAEAERIFQHILASTGDSPDLRILFGMAFKATEQWQDAAREFERAIALDPTYPRAHYYLGLTLLLQGGASAFEAAMQEFQAELDRNPDDYLANFYLGLVHTLRRDDEDALHYLHRAIEIEPSNPDPYLYAGQVLVRSEKTQEAIEALRTSIALTKNPGRNSFQVSNAEYVLGQALLKSGNREKAVRHIQKSQELKRLQYEASQAEFQSRRDSGVSAAPSGMASHDLRDLKDADSSLNLDRPSPGDQPEHFLSKAAATVFESVAALASEHKDFAGAAGYLEIAVRLTPEQADLFNRLSQAYAQAGQREQAEEALAKYHELVQ